MPGQEEKPHIPGKSRNKDNDTFLRINRAAFLKSGAVYAFFSSQRNCLVFMYMQSATKMALTLPQASLMGVSEILYYGES
ncbi:hypothetical protein LJC36_04630 [Desulfovibrio sp. OttesenSCG-928-C14]|nr:hypothetical protein [Desulfovibrio sp. OttesenSCG-928-C14]